MSSPVLEKTSKFSWWVAIDPSSDWQRYWLTPKQLKFAQVYLQCNNWHEAVRQAYPEASNNTLARMSYDLLRKSKIQAYFDLFLKTHFNEKTVKNIALKRALDNTRTERSQDSNLRFMWDILGIVKNSGTVSNTQILNVQNVLNVIQEPKQAIIKSNPDNEFTIEEQAISKD
jgi:hypothetical protein